MTHPEFSGTTVGRLLLGFLLSGFLLLTATAAEIPYSAALDAAAVNLPDVSDISKKGLIVGNGELNAIVYSSGNEIRLRVSKNDCWDMRITTDENPPLPIVDVAKQTFTGEQGKAQPSWEKYVHPTALPCTDISLAGASGQTAWKSAKLDLAKAAATILSNVDTTTVRVLSQRNVILIDSARAIALNGVGDLVKDRDGKPISGWVSAAKTGKRGNLTCLQQNIPGNDDVSGMDVFVVAGRDGSKQAIAVVTSRESKQPLEDAVKMVEATLADANAVASHEAEWQTFWSRSGVALGDTMLQNWWYRMVYFFRCFARPGGNVIGLQAAFDQLGGWHNSLTLNYNAQQIYLTAGPINHPELIEPFVDVLQRNLNRAKWFAKTSFPGSEGAYFHVNLWPFEPDPAKCVTRNKHQHAYMPWGYSWGTNGHSAAVLWDYARFKPGEDSLRRIWQTLEQFALFYCSVLEMCPMVDGRRRIGPTYFAETGEFGVSKSSYDIVFIKFTLNAAIRAARLMGNPKLAERCTANLATLPDYPIETDPSHGGTVIGQWLGGGLPKYMNIGSEVMSLFPADEVTWMSDPSVRELLVRTINHSEKVTQHINSNVAMNIARARLGLGEEAIANAKMCFNPASDISAEQPNGLFYWKIHGYYLSEQVCIARLVSELLLQSAGEVIRIFPAWPRGVDGKFSRLLAQGGFEVSAERIADVIQNVNITSTAGGSVTIANPWPESAMKVVSRKSGIDIPTTRTVCGVTFSTTAGDTYALSPETNP
ncbi:MAG: hypothetical protein J0M04_04050 [Verrucomicrobia bacterium]|nr:hypothetical protein [Verrucomicrobiota bacterium]